MHINLPTDICLELPNMAYTRGGRKEEYSPYTTLTFANNAKPIAKKGKTPLLLTGRLDNNY